MDPPDPLRQAAKDLLSLGADARVRLIAAPTVDALAGAALLGLAFRRQKRSIHVTVANPEDAKDVDRIVHDPYDANILLGLPFLPRLVGRNITVAPRPPTISLAGACFELAVLLGPGSEDLAPIMLVGAWAAGAPPPASREGQLAERLLAEGRLPSSTRLDLVDAPVPSALARGAPWTLAFPTLEEADRIITEAGLAAAATPNEYGPRESEHLASLVVLRLLRAGFPGHRVRELVRRVPESPLHRDTPLPRIAHLSAVGLGRGDAGLVLAYLMGDVAAGNELEALESQDVTEGDA